MTKKPARRARSPVADHRARKARQGFVRVEVNVRKQDAALVRGVAAALSDPLREEGARTLILRHFAEVPTQSLKALLASAPLEGIELERDTDTGRNVEL